MLGILFSLNMTAFADTVGEVGGTDQGNTSGSNVYTFYYQYNANVDAIVLKVTTKRAISSFGNSTSYTYTSPSDDVVLNTQNPVLGSSLENAIADMNSAGGYDLSVSDVKATLNKLGYYDKGNGIWEYDGGYLTYISAELIRPQTHTITYNANGGSGAPSSQTKTEDVTLYLSTVKPTRTGYTFQYWVASIGGNYSSGAAYTHDQDGGTVTMKAYWLDTTAPTCSAFTATPTVWSSGNGTVSFTARDQGSGLASVTLERYSYVTRSWSTVKTWMYSGTTSSVSESYTETSEGVFYYKLTIKDQSGNTTTKTSSTIYLDHSNPVLTGVTNTNTEWTNVAPVISVSATDYLTGTTYTGSNLASVVIKDYAGNVVSSGTNSASFTVTSKYEGVYTWTIVATDNVGHTRSSQVTTKYDITKPVVEGTETTYVTPDGLTVSGYCQDNIISQYMDDVAGNSANSPNVTSGLKSVLLYRVTNGVKTLVSTDTTKAVFSSSNTSSNFTMYYDIGETEEYEEYYQIVVEDYAGNITIKKLTSQRSLLSWFHTSIDRSTYE